MAFRHGPPPDRFERALRDSHAQSYDVDVESAPDGVG
jgi:hypothetical protein